MSCHQYPTWACVAGNGEVRSPWDNVASSLPGWQLNREGRLRRPVPGRRELGLGSTVNIRESLITVVKNNKPKVLKDWFPVRGLTKRYVDGYRNCPVSCRSSRSTGGEARPTLPDVIDAERGKPVGLPIRVGRS